jgi:hypothetical protein
MQFFVSRNATKRIENHQVPTGQIGGQAELRGATAFEAAGFYANSWNIGRKGKNCLGEAEHFVLDVRAGESHAY